MNSAAAALAETAFGNYDTFPNADLPKLPLPRNTWTGGLTGCYIYDEKNQNQNG